MSKSWKQNMINHKTYENIKQITTNTWNASEQTGEIMNNYEKKQETHKTIMRTSREILKHHEQKTRKARSIIRHHERTKKHINKNKNKSGNIIRKP